MARTGGGFITFGKIVAGGLKPHNFLSKMSLRTTSEKKQKKEKRMISLQLMKP